MFRLERPLCMASPSPPAASEQSCFSLPVHGACHATLHRYLSGPCASWSRRGILGLAHRAGHLLSSQDDGISSCMQMLAALAPSQDTFCSCIQLHAYHHACTCMNTRTCPRMQDAATGLPRDQWCMKVEAKARHA